jgi:hypothetical protein
MTLSPNGRFSKERRNPRSSFLLQYDNEIECPVCFEKIEVGSRVRYREDGLIVHVRHRKADPVETPCPRCWLVHPGECD